MLTKSRAAFTLAKGGLSDSRGRAAYLVLTLAVAIAAWLAMAAMAEPFVGGGESSGSGVTIRNGSQIHSQLPLRYAERIVATTGAHNVAWQTLQLVNCKSDVTVTINAYGGPGTLSQVSSPQAPIDPDTIKRWQADPRGILISDKVVTDCGWNIGQGVAPPDAFGGKNISLQVSGVFHDSDDIVIAHYDYINRTAPLFGGKDKVTEFSANAGSARADEQLATRIAAEFAHDFPTVSATTNTTVQNAWARFGKVQRLLAFVMAAILSCAASVLISVLAHAALQRRPGFALLQVLGFRRGVLFGAVVLEATAILIAGAALGIGLGKLATHLLASTGFGFFSGGFAIPGWAFAWMPLWLLLLVAASLAWPALVVARVRPHHYKAI